MGVKTGKNKLRARASKFEVRTRTEKKIRNWSIVQPSKDLDNHNILDFQLSLLAVFYKEIIDISSKC